MKNKTILNVFNNKEYVIWGLGNIGREFFEKYRFKQPILYGTCNGEENIAELKKIDKRDVLSKTNNFYTIICAAAFESIAEELISAGKKMLDDFLPYNIVSAIWDEMPIMLFVGQCELQWICDMLQFSENILKSYSLIYVAENKILNENDSNVSSVNEFFLKIVCSVADFFIYPVSLNPKRDNWYAEVKELLSLDCICVGVPFASFDAYWPQDNLDYEKTLMKSDIYGYKNAFQGRRDLNVERYLESELKDQIINNISDDSFYSQEYIKNHFKRSINKVKVYEKKADIIISDFLENNFRQVQLYADRGHMYAIVAKEYAVRILDYLNIECNREEILMSNAESFDNILNQFPIYPSVQKSLNFKKNSFMPRLGNIKVSLDFKTYMKVYINFLEAEDGLFTLEDLLVIN